MSRTVKNREASLFLVVHLCPNYPEDTGGGGDGEN